MALAVVGLLCCTEQSSFSLRDFHFFQGTRWTGVGVRIFASDGSKGTIAPIILEGQQLPVREQVRKEVVNFHHCKIPVVLDTGGCLNVLAGHLGSKDRPAVPLLLLDRVGLRRMRRVDCQILRGAQRERVERVGAAASTN